MDIESKLEKLFVTKDSPNVPKDSNSQMELKKIENQLNLHMKNKQGLKYKKVSLAYDKAYDEEKFGHVIDKELTNKLINKKWKGLPMFMKWRLVDEYLHSQNITDKIYINELREKLSKNNLEVKYEDKKVIEIL